MWKTQAEPAPGKSKTKAIFSLMSIGVLCFFKSHLTCYPECKVGKASLVCSNLSVHESSTDGGFMEWTSLYLHLSYFYHNDLISKAFCKIVSQKLLWLIVEQFHSFLHYEAQCKNMFFPGVTSSDALPTDTPPPRKRCLPKGLLRCRLYRAHAGPPRQRVLCQVPLTLCVNIMCCAPLFKQEVITRRHRAYLNS